MAVLSTPLARAAAHVAGPNAAYALERATERGLGLIAEPLGHLRDRRATSPQHLFGQVHAPRSEVLHRRVAKQRGEAFGEYVARHARLARAGVHVPAYPRPAV